MKVYAFSLILAAGMVLAPVSMAEQAAPAFSGSEVQDARVARDMKMRWWRDAKFGMFIHYGVYAGLAGEFKGKPGGTEWIQCNLGLDTDTYAAEALPLFRPAEDCAEQWAELAESAGCRYAVFTTKHHDGFAMFDTAVSDYSSMKLLGRDIAREFVEAFRSKGMKIGFYHSVIDWHHPAYDNTICPDLCYPSGQAAMLKSKGIPRNQEEYCQYLHAQVAELLSGRYGTVDIMWWDYSQGAAEGDRAWKASELMQKCREHNPTILMNNRLFSFSGFDHSEDSKALDFSKGDFSTPEKRIPAKGYPGRDWEACMTVGNAWGYNRYDIKYKSPSVIIRQLQECAAKGGNLLLNIGPRADGSVPEEVEEIFHCVGDWMELNSEAIYSSRPVEGELTLPEGMLACVVWDDIYIFLHERTEAETGDYVLRIPAGQLEAVTPEILGMPDFEVLMERVEEPGAEEPTVYMQFTIPAEVWAEAPQGLPVLKLGNAR